MNGPEHYREACLLLDEVASESLDEQIAGKRLAAAQVHATLALAAATAQQLADRYRGDGDHINAWQATWRETS